MIDVVNYLMFTGKGALPYEVPPSAVRFFVFPYSVMKGSRAT